MSDYSLKDLADTYYASLPNKNVNQPKRVVLFSGVAGSGKSTVARAIEKELHAVRVSNDEIRDSIVAAYPMIGVEDREQAKFDIGTEVLKRLANKTSGLIVIDASCDRGYDHYRSWATKHGYAIVLLRMDVPRAVIEQRLHERGNQGHREVARSLGKLNTWWKQWEMFGEEHTPDLIITPDTPTREVLTVVAGSRTTPPANP